MPEVITNNLSIWTAALKRKSSAGRGKNGKTSPHGINKLRALILELAVRGKLVRQDPNNEPASVLLEKIAENKARLIKDGLLKKGKKLPEPDNQEKLYLLPAGWSWARLGDVVDIVRGITFPASEKSKIRENGRLACLRTTNVQSEIEWDDLLFIREAFVKRDEQLIHDQDIVMSMANSRELVGKVAIIKSEPESATTFGGFLAVLRARMLNPAYLMVLLKSPLNRNLLIDSASQTINLANISLGKLNPLVLAIPPLAEQHRIVAKVDELMTLCDQLEQQQTDSLQAHQTLVRVFLDRMVDNANTGQAIHAELIDAFDTLFTTEAAIDQLKQTILQLAVMGKLVPFGKNKRNIVLKDLVAFGPKNGFSPKEVSHETGMKVLKLGATSYGALDVNQSKFIDEPIPSDSHLWLMEGDILIQRGNSANYVGSNLLLHEDCDGFIYPDLMMKVRANELVESRFLSLALSAPCSREFMWARMTGTSGTMPKISKRIVESVQLTLPVEKEIQRNVVAKVDELMTLCDTLKARLNEAQTTQAQLADAVVEQAVG